MSRMTSACKHRSDDGEHASVGDCDNSQHELLRRDVGLRLLRRVRSVSRNSPMVDS